LLFKPKVAHEQFTRKLAKVELSVYMAFSRGISGYGRHGVKVPGIAAIVLVCGIAIAFPLAIVSYLLANPIQLDLRDIAPARVAAAMHVLAAMLLGGAAGLLSCWVRLLCIAHTANRVEKRTWRDALAIHLLVGLGILGTPSLVIGLGVFLSALLCSWIYLAIHRAALAAHLWPAIVSPDATFTVLLTLGAATIFAATWGIYAVWQRLNRRLQLGIAPEVMHADVHTKASSLIVGEPRHRQFSIRQLLAAIGCVAVLSTIAGLAWRDAVDPQRYSKRFSRSFAYANRIVVRAGGHDLREHRVLCDIAAPETIDELRSNLQFVDGVPGGGCLCYGFPSLDWYRGSTRLAVTGIQHGRGLRWLGFPGDAFFTPESAEWLKHWFEQNGLDEDRLNALQRGER